MKVFHGKNRDRLSGAPSAVALGCFDGLHRGHREVVRCAVEGKERGLTPAVFTFESHTMKTLSGTAASSLMTFSDKKDVLSSWGVEELYLERFEDVRAFSPEEFVRDVLYKTYNAKLVCCGFNYRFGAGSAGKTEDLRRLGERCGMEVYVCPAVSDNGEAISSTRIRACVLSGDMDTAHRLLGRPFRYNFPVVKGNQIGRLLGTPTLNQRFGGDFILPRFGVYASSVLIDGEEFYAVTNVGMRPTVGTDRPLSETWIPGFSGDLYGRDVLVSLHGFLREERKFPSLEALRAAILRDAARAEEVFRTL